MDDDCNNSLISDPLDLIPSVMCIPLLYVVLFGYHNFVVYSVRRYIVSGIRQKKIGEGGKKTQIET